jgi:histidinol-phosphate phosphatase family protein
VTQAVILAGGKGTRLAEVSGGLPKPLVPVDGIPIIERQIALLVRYGIEEIFLTTGYRAAVLQDQLGDGTRLGARLHHIVEETALGTAGGVAALRDRLTERFLVVYGDVMVHMDLAHLMAVHADAGAEATVVVHPNDHPYDSDLVELEGDGRIAAFHPKPRSQDGPDLRNQVSAALYVLEPSALDAIEVGVKQDFVQDVFPRMLESGARIQGYATTEYLKDMGTPDRLARVEADCRSGLVERLHRDHGRPTAFLDRDGVINEEIDGVHRPADLRLLPGAANAVQRLNRAGWLCCVVTNQPALAKGFMDESDLEGVHRRLETALGEARAWVDGIEHCPHHPDRGFAGERADLKIACTCRKPAPGMLDAFTDRLPVDASASILVGDSWRDMALAHARGLDAIGVMTGHGLSAPAPASDKLAGRPDILVPDLAAAAALVLDPSTEIDSLSRSIAQRASEATGQPVVVLIGGQSRAGKTTVAFRLRRALRQLQLGSTLVCLDDWLVPASERTPGQSLESRYRLDVMGADIDALVAGQPVLAPGYDVRSREALGQAVPYALDRNAVLILEGVPALLLHPNAKACLRVNVVTPDDRVRAERLRTFYRYKGIEAPAMEELLEGRREEYDRVAEAGRSADTDLRGIPEVVDEEGGVAS